MCGICGIWYFDLERQVNPTLLQTMNDQLAHRGPDEAGLHCDGSFGLAVRRLSIIDGTRSRQPLLNEDRHLCLACNGEIYNFYSLRQRLSPRHHFSTNGDCETILHLYEDCGIRCVHDLRGMFAFALWDGHADQLTLAVDRFGKKPLYYMNDTEKIVFASELKALLRCPSVPRNLDPQAIDEYLSCGYISAPRSIYKDIHKLTPGHLITVQRDGSVRSEQYWQPTFAEPADWERRSQDELAAELRDLLIEAVRLRMVADVPLGAFLSGGVDSSAVVALMTHVGNKPVKTYSIGFDDPAYDESAYAHAAADFLHSDHIAQVIHTDALDLLPRLVKHYDEPFADSSMIPTYLISQLARSEVTVVLTGDGGDEVFGGYHQHLYAYRQLYLQSIIPSSLHPLTARFTQFIPNRLKVKPYLAALGKPAEHWLGSTFFSPQRHFYSAEARRDAFQRSSHLDELSQLQYHDLTVYLPGDILVKLDRATMLASLEARCPLLDHTIFEFMARISPHQRVSVTSGKALLKKALEPFLPAFVLDRKKQGFSIPQAEWLRGPLYPLLRETLSKCNLFDQSYIQQLIVEHSSGHVDHKDRLWALLCFELWASQAE